MGIYEDVLWECYNLASNSNQNELSIELIKRKQGGLIHGKINNCANNTVPTIPTQVLSEALQELSVSSSETNRRIVSDKQSKVAMLPPSGEKEYILALYALQNGISDENTNLIYSHISAALSSSDKALFDPRYRALADLIQDLKRK